MVLRIEEEERGTMELQVVVSVRGRDLDLQQGWLGQLLYGHRTAECNMQGILVAMNQILDQFQGTACNRYACHPANPQHEDNLFLVADLQKMKEQGIVSVNSGCDLEEPAALELMLPISRADFRKQSAGPGAETEFGVADLHKTLNAIQKTQEEGFDAVKQSL